MLDRGKLVAQGTPSELKHRIGSGHVRLQFADVSGLESAIHILGDVTRDDDALTLQIPSDGNVRSIKAQLDRLDDESIVVNDLSIHTPDLDDVFFALTENSNTQKGTIRLCVRQHVEYRTRLRDT